MLLENDEEKRKGKKEESTSLPLNSQSDVSMVTHTHNVNAVLTDKTVFERY